MFLKLAYGNATKKVVFRPEFSDFAVFMSFLEKITHLRASEIKIFFVDKENDQLEMNDQYGLEYFIEQTKNDQFANIRIEPIDGSDSQARFFESTISSRDNPEIQQQSTQKNEVTKFNFDLTKKDILPNQNNNQKAQNEPTEKKKVEYNFPEINPISFFGNKNQNTTQKPEIKTELKKDVKSETFFQQTNVFVNKDIEKKPLLKIFEDKKSSPKKQISFFQNQDIFYKEKPHDFKAIVNNNNQISQKISNDIPLKIENEHFFHSKKLRPLEQQVSSNQNFEKKNDYQVITDKAPVLNQNEVKIQTIDILNQKQEDNIQASILKRLEFLENHIESLNQSFITKSIVESNIQGDIIPKELKQAPVQLSTVLTKHVGVNCDSCHQQNFQGRRFKCLVCDDFDLCENCEAKTPSHAHPMIRVVNEADNNVLNELYQKYNKMMAKMKCHKFREVQNKKQECKNDAKLAFLMIVCPNNPILQQNLMLKHCRLNIEEFTQAVLKELTSK